jgi:hypothetical protein
VSSVVPVTSGVPLPFNVTFCKPVTVKTPDAEKLIPLDVFVAIE